METVVALLLVICTVIPTVQSGLTTGRPTNQTGYSSKTSDLAVDGYYGDKNGSDEYCAQPYSEQSRQSGIMVQWTVDLESRYNIESITVSNTYYTDWSAAFTQFTVGILNGVNSEVVCHNKTTPGAKGENVTFSCPGGRSVGRYIHLTSYDRQPLVLCEVVATGTPYNKDPVFDSCTPNVGPVSGGTMVTIRGQNLHGGVGNLKAGSLLPLQIQSWTSTRIVAMTSNASQVVRNIALGLTAEVYGGRRVDLPCEITIRADPTIERIYPLSTIREGGTSLMVDGSSMRAVASPELKVTTNVSNVLTRITPDVNNYYQLCSVESDTSLRCIVPEMDLPDLNDNQYDIIISLGLILDGIPDYRDLRNHPTLHNQSTLVINTTPVFGQTQQIVFPFEKKKDITILGENVQAIPQMDYQVTVGGEECVISTYTDTSLHCLPPQSRPSGSDEDPQVIVHVGENRRYTVGTMVYQPNNLPLIIGCSVAAVLVVIIVIIIVVVVRRQKSRAKKKKASAVNDNPGFEPAVDEGGRIQLGPVNTRGFEEPFDKQSDMSDDMDDY